MDLKKARREQLNKITHSVRASQAVLQYGVGAMVDFKDQTLMTAAPEYWSESIKVIHDERLEKVLHVDYFGMPIDQDERGYKDGISYARFPEWYFCPKCRKFQSLSEWITEYRKKSNQRNIQDDPNMIRGNHIRCNKCGQNLVVSRIIVACAHGHIDDFPWVDWVHCQNNGGAKDICANPSLIFKTGASSTEGLEGLIVKCESCNATATLRGAFDHGKFEELDEQYVSKYNFRCSGRHPWKNSREKCGQYPHVLQRGSSSVYFPILASSLVIPPYSSLLTKKIEECVEFENCKKVLASIKTMPLDQETKKQLKKKTIQDSAEKISLSIGEDEEQVKAVLERRWCSDENEEISTTSVKFRAEEYEALRGEVKVDTKEYGDFVREEVDIKDYDIPFIKGISLIHKVREVQALIGFSRIEPVEDSEKSDVNEKIVSVKQEETKWYPAYEVRGEGIFIEFCEEDINKWRNENYDLKRRVDILNENYSKSYMSSSKPRKITAKYLLLHTISHLLIKQLSFECGYNVASLKERIYCSEVSEGRSMNGILIYTASGDSEGTLGGLVRQGRVDTFPKLFRKAIESAMTCSNDPVCSLSLGQGRDSLNLSACYSCTLIPETSCEDYNVFLDRSVVVGSIENPRLGFFYNQLVGNSNWKSNRIGIIDAISNDYKISIIERGLDMKNIEFSEIWKDLGSFSDDETERRLMKELVNRDFSKKEKPMQDCRFIGRDISQKYYCDLYWEHSNVAFFTKDNIDGYEVAKKSKWSCYLASDDSFDIEKFLAELKED